MIEILHVTIEACKDILAGMQDAQGFWRNYSAQPPEYYKGYEDGVAAVQSILGRHMRRLSTDEQVEMMYEGLIEVAKRRYAHEQKKKERRES